ncbi:MAG TPA: fructose-bisphosphate aldolase [Anaerolineae bacterium]|nr:fructose-bisphosphate aldolase [Anaerolineae bacterium]
MTSIGKEVRLGKLFNKHSGNSVMVAMDHGAIIGPVHGIKNPRDIVKNLCVVKPDTLFMPIGIIKRVYTEFIENDIPFIASIDTCTYLGPEPYNYILADTVEHALSIGACGVSIHVIVGPEKTSKMLKQLAKISIKCDELGMPLLAIMYPGGFDKNLDPDNVKWVARIGAELGADVVKTCYTGSKKSFMEVVDSCPVPVLLSGGVMTKEPKEFLSVLKNCMDAGGHGCAVGRNVWQHGNPQAMIKAIKKIVHEGSTVNRALEELKR